MALPRFFVNLPSEAFTGRVELPAKAAHHAGRALRMAAGERTVLFNGSGDSWEGPIGFEGNAAWVDVDTVRPPAFESPLNLTLVQAWVAPEKLDWIVEKAVEAGVTRLVLAPARRCVTKLSGARLDKRLDKCRETVVAASEQCGRNRLMRVDAVARLSQAWAVEADWRLCLSPNAVSGAPAGSAPRSIAFAVGPEGGFDDEEIQEARQAGWRCTLLGPRVLRTETAGLAAAVWANTLFGDYPKA